MWCPSCNKEVELSEGDPSTSRVRLKNGVLTADIEITDLCGEDFTPLRNAKMSIERDLKDIDVLKPHVEKGHEWKVEVQRSERIPGLPGYVGVIVRFLLMCSCGELEPYHGSIATSAEMKEVK